MAAESNTMLLRREMLTRMAKQMYEGKLFNEIDRIPIKIRPKNSDESRCCIYKDRAVLKYKMMAMLGVESKEETDELKPLADYAAEDLEKNKTADRVLNVADEACSACQKINYVVTNMCRGCVGRPCMVNCPKDAIEFRDGKAHIIQDKCVNCGKCEKVCPFHAVIYTPVPCEEACPVDAISKDENGKEQIDLDKCIYCGKCMEGCPFGAIVEKTHMLRIISDMLGDKKVVALVAPAIAGQFKNPMEKITGSLKKLGFTDVVEVAKGADKTTDHEAAEFVERMQEGAGFMTTSCCPAYTNLVKRHIQELEPKVSETKTPLHYTAEGVKKADKDAITVFVSPCVSKKYEAMHDEYVDYVLSFEEFGAMLIAKGIDIDECEANELDTGITAAGRGYPVTSGVTRAVQSKLPAGVDMKELIVNGIDKQQIRELKRMASKGSGDINFVEVMSCPEGCVGGCNAIAKSKVAKKQVDNFVKKLEKEMAGAMAEK
jgi:[FeFe] hydrogenase (group B1/B3)